MKKQIIGAMVLVLIMAGILIVNAGPVRPDFFPNPSTATVCPHCNEPINITVTN